MQCNTRKMNKRSRKKTCHLVFFSRAVYDMIFFLATMKMNAVPSELFHFPIIKCEQKNDIFFSIALSLFEVKGLRNKEQVHFLRQCNYLQWRSMLHAILVFSTFFHWFAIFYDRLLSLLPSFPRTCLCMNQIYFFLHFSFFNHSLTIPSLAQAEKICLSHKKCLHQKTITTKFLLHACGKKTQNKAQVNETNTNQFTFVAFCLWMEFLRYFFDFGNLSSFFFNQFWYFCL